MPWQSLGVVTVGENWATLPSDVINCEVLRISHTTTVDYTINSCWLARYFPLPSPGGRLAPWLRLYPSDEPQILNLPIPSDYRNQSILVYSLQVKWRFPYYPVPWQIEIEALY